MSKTPRPSVVDNVLWGIRWGVAFAGGFTVLGFIPALIRAFTGATALGGRAVSFVTIIGIYIVSGISAGAIVGLFRPVLTNVFGAIATGIIAMIPVAIAIRAAIIGLHGWSIDDGIPGIIFIVVMGGGGSIIIWRESRH